MLWPASPDATKRAFTYLCRGGCADRLAGGVGNGHQEGPSYAMWYLQKQLVALFLPSPESAMDTLTEGIPDAFLIPQTCNFLGGEDAVTLMSSPAHKYRGWAPSITDTRKHFRDNYTKVIKVLIKVAA